MRDWEDNDRNMFVNCSWSSVAVLHHRLSATPLKCDGPSLKLSGSVWRCGLLFGLKSLHIVFENVTWAGGNIYWIIFSIFWALVSSCSSRTSVLHLCFSFNLFVLFNFCTVTFPFLERVKQLWHEPSFCHCFQFRCSFYFVEFNLICLVVTFRFLSLSFFRPFTCI